jgi:hypothetical protein
MPPQAPQGKEKQTTTQFLNANSCAQPTFLSLTPLGFQNNHQSSLHQGGTITLPWTTQFFLP